MGLSIHYSGSFRKNANLSEMIEEVKDIAEIYKWKYHIYGESIPKSGLGKETYTDKIYGISITPPECETLSLEFLSNGRMSNAAYLKYFGKSENEEERKYLYMLSTKTQFAGAQTHKIIVHLLKYLSEKYFSDFNVFDEGKYWETRDEKLLDETFNDYNELLDGVSNALQNFPIKSGESVEGYFERVLKKIHQKTKEK